MTSKMVNLLGGSEQMISMILVITKARVVSIGNGKFKGFRLYYGKKKKRWVKYRKISSKKWVVEKSG